MLDDAVETMLGRLTVPDLDHLTADAFWPTLRRWVTTWITALDFSSDVFRVAAQFTAERRASPRFAPILAKSHALYRRLIEPGQRLGCVRTDLPVDVLVRLLEANDAALDGIFLSRDVEVTQEGLEGHTKLIFDTFKRLLVAELPKGGR